MKLGGSINPINATIKFRPFLSGDGLRTLVAVMATCSPGAFFFVCVFVCVCAGKGGVRYYLFVSSLSTA